METITIEKLARFTQDKDGRAYVTKYGKPYKKLLINDENGRKIKLNDWDGLTESWKEGMQISINVQQKTYNGFDYLEGTIPNVKSRLSENMEDYGKRIAALEKAVFGASKTPTVAKAVVNTLNQEKLPVETSVDDDLPF